MSEKKNVKDVQANEEVLDKAQDLWTRYSKPIIVVGAVIVLLVAGFFVYKNMIQKPKETKAADAMFKAEEYYRKDSINQALNGDGQNPGFLRIISRYSGTDAANLAHFYAGSCYIKLNDNANAIKHLKDFSTDAKQVQQRAYKLLGDASADMGKNAEALDYYKKAGRHFEEDDQSSAEALFMAAYLADRVLKNQKEAIALYKELKEKYPNTKYGFDAENYLAQLGVYNMN